MKNLLKKESLMELFRYGIIGTATTAVNYGIYTLLLGAGWNYLTANTIAWVFAVSFSYIANRTLVFRSDNHISKELFSFVSLRFMTLLTENALLFCFIQLLYFHPLISKLGVSVITVLGNYIICKSHIFSKGAAEHE